MLANLIDLFVFGPREALVKPIGLGLGQEIIDHGIPLGVIGRIDFLFFLIGLARAQSLLSLG